MSWKSPESGSEGAEGENSQPAGGESEPARVWIHPSELGARFDSSYSQNSKENQDTASTSPGAESLYPKPIGVLGRRVALSVSIFLIAFGFVALERFTLENRSASKSASSSGASKPPRRRQEAAVGVQKVDASKSIATIHIRQGERLAMISGICVQGGIVTAADSVSQLGIEVTASTEAGADAKQHPLFVRSVDEVSGLAYLTGYQCPESQLSMEQRAHWHPGQSILMASGPHMANPSAPLRAQVFREGNVMAKTQFGRTGDAILLPIFDRGLKKAAAAMASMVIGTALVNMSGDFMGIVIAEDKGSYLAIPSAMAYRVIGQFIRAETVEGGWLGVELDASGEVLDVAPNSPAQRAGINKGERIYASEGSLTVGLESLLTSLQAHAPGDRYPLTIEYQGRTRNVTVMLGSRPSS